MYNQEASLTARLRVQLWPAGILRAPESGTNRRADY